MDMLKHNVCSVCQKGAGICNCAGCKAFFCTKDFMEHRQRLSGEFEQVVEDRNQLQEEMTERKQFTHLQTSLLSQIDQWENVTIEKVHYAAENTRHQVIQLLNDKIKDIENELDNVTKQLRDLQAMDNFVENDLAYLKDNVNKLEKNFRQITEPPSVKLQEEHSEQIEWTSVIYADDKCARDDKVTVVKILKQIRFLHDPAFLTRKARGKSGILEF
jgi:chromosome segregation ATPase